jgi:epoxyqueuosine reductase
MSKALDFQALRQESCKFSTISIGHLADLHKEIEKRRDKNEFDSKFYEEYMFRFKFAPPEELTNAKSLIIIAMPRPPTHATFTWKGKKQSFILPPTYTAYDEKRFHAERLVAEAVAKDGYKAVTTVLPLKLLATRSGLAKYGKNNITYTSGMGSFMRLTAVYSDMPCENDQWQKAEIMELCENCNLCQKACPTGAIDPDRFLLRAERCLTFHNEKKSSIPFPDWIKPEWHNCIIGCIRCQAACPENRRYLQLVGETAEFDEEETRLILKGTPKEQMPASMLKKMKLLSLTDYLEEVPRNLSVLLR